jgi:hypothetical protein
MNAAVAEFESPIDIVESRRIGHIIIREPEAECSNPEINIVEHDSREIRRAFHDGERAFIDTLLG